MVCLWWWISGVQAFEWCQVTKDNHSAAPYFMGHVLASRPNEILAFDFTMARNKLKNVLVMTDVFGKYTLAISTHDQRASGSGG